MSSSFHFTPKQLDALELASSHAKHVLLEGGSRSGKTFIHCRNIATRALKAPRSRHAILRFRFNHLKASVIADTWPKMMRLCFDGIPWEMSRTDWYVTFPNGAEIWFAGLDDKDRVEKVLGQEHATIFLNECSQISYEARNYAVTRLAQNIETVTGKPLRLKMYYDCNPPSTAHWVYKLFHEHRNPDTREALPNSEQYAYMRINPDDNLENLPEGYIDELDALPGRYRRRFREGLYTDANPAALFAQEHLDRYRVVDGQVPDLQRIIVAVDPSGASDEDNAENDEIGLVVGGLGVDGNGYLLEDLSLKAGPGTWGKAAVAAWERHDADKVVGEVNFGGAMVEYTIKSCAGRRRVPFGMVHASRGKVQRAEPVAALYEEGRIRHVGHFHALEDELMAFATFGYTGEGSPNRADAVVWLWSELFPGLVRPRREEKPKKAPRRREHVPGSWMGA